MQPEWDGIERTEAHCLLKPNWTQRSEEGQ